MNCFSRNILVFGPNPKISSVIDLGIPFNAEIDSYRNFHTGIASPEIFRFLARTQKYLVQPFWPARTRKYLVQSKPERNRKGPFSSRSCFASLRFDFVSLSFHFRNEAKRKRNDTKTNRKLKTETKRKRYKQRDETDTETRRTLNENERKSGRDGTTTKTRRKRNGNET